MPFASTTSSQRLLFLNTSSGTGKTFLTLAIQRFLKSHWKRVPAVPSSEVAAQLLDGERTIYSALKIPISIHAKSTCNIDKKFFLAEEIRRTGLIIWNEIVVTHRHNIDAVNRTLQGLSQSVLPFGGIAVLLTADF